MNKKQDISKATENSTISIQYPEKEEVDEKKSSNKLKIIIISVIIKMILKKSYIHIHFSFSVILFSSIFYSNTEVKIIIFFPLFQSEFSVSTFFSHLPMPFYYNNQI